MPFNFDQNQLVLQDMATAEPGKIGWAVTLRQEKARLVLIVKQEIDGPPQCLFVDLEGEHKFTLRRIGNIEHGQHSMLKLPTTKFSVELSDGFRTHGGDGAMGAIHLTNDGAYLSVLLSTQYGDAERYFVNLKDFSVDDNWPNGVKTVISTWKMVAGAGTEQTVLTEVQEP